MLSRETRCPSVWTYFCVEKYVSARDVCWTNTRAPENTCGNTLYRPGQVADFNVWEMFGFNVLYQYSLSLCKVVYNKVVKCDFQEKHGRLLSLIPRSSYTDTASSRLV